VKNLFLVKIFTIFSLFLVCSATAGTKTISEPVLFSVIAEEEELSDFERFISQGNNLYSQGSFIQALLQYQQALKINPDNPKIINNVGVCYHRAGMTELAIKYYRQALKMDANLVNTHDNLALALHKNGNFDEALVEYRRSCDLGNQITCDWLKLNNF